VGRMAGRRLGGAGLQEESWGRVSLTLPFLFQLDEAMALLHSKSGLVTGIVAAGRLKP
jgi:hypothetical protein